MPDSHPNYEETFSRIATILDVMAEDRQKHEAALEASDRPFTESRAEWDSRHAALQKAMAEWIAFARERDDEFNNKLARLAEQDAVFNAKLEKLIERDSETTDKLNGLIDLVDHHIREK